MEVHGRQKPLWCPSLPVWGCALERSTALYSKNFSLSTFSAGTPSRRRTLSERHCRNDFFFSLRHIILFNFNIELIVRKWSSIIITTMETVVARLKMLNLSELSLTCKYFVYALIILNLNRNCLLYFVALTAFFSFVYFHSKLSQLHSTFYHQKLS